MSAVRCDVEAVGTRLVVRVDGELSVSTAPVVRTALLKCLAEEPDVVVVDLSRTAVVDPAAVAVFHAASRQAALWPGTPLMIAAPDPAVARLLTPGYGRLAVHRSLDEALTVEPRRRMHLIKDRLLPVSGAARHARDLAAEACARWDLPHLIGPACVVACELVTNAVVHAQTMIDLRITLGRRFLIVAVRDGGADEPVLPSPATDDPADPRGLLLVETMSHRWGFLPAQGGKVVWATLSRNAS